LQRQDLDDQRVIRLEPRLTEKRPVARVLRKADSEVGAWQGFGALLGTFGGARGAESTRGSLGSHRLENRALLIGRQIPKDLDLLGGGCLRDGRETLQGADEQPGHGNNNATRPHPNETLHAYS
jgi:hypothetical protein